jgi:hypothetical protein
MTTFATSLLRSQFQSAHNWLEGTLADVTQDQAHWIPDGKPNPIGAQYAHVLLSEDLILSLVKGKTPLMMSSHTGDKMGISEPPPVGPWGEWARSVRIDLPALRAYGQAIYAASDEILRGMSDADLDQSINLTALGFGHEKTSFALNIVLLNVFSHTGEISALKGLQGMKGYPT